jgi:hypothetical protein
LYQPTAAVRKPACWASAKMVHAQPVGEAEVEVLDLASGQQRWDHLDRLEAGGLHVGEERALAAERVEVRQAQVVRPMLEDLVERELVEDDPDDAGMDT